MAREAIADHPSEAALCRLADLSAGIDQHGHEAPQRLLLTTKAVDILEAFSRELVERADLAIGGYAGSIGKARGHALRLSCILEHLWWCASDGRSPEPTEISATAVRAAVGLVDGYFLPAAQKVFSDASIPQPERAAMALLRSIKQERASKFNARELRRKAGGLLRESKDMDAACSVLTEANLIRPISGQYGPNKGRPAKDFEVNPVCIEQPDE